MPSRSWSKCEGDCMDVRELIAKLEALSEEEKELPVCVFRDMTGRDGTGSVFYIEAETFDICEYKYCTQTDEFGEHPTDSREGRFITLEHP